MKNFLKKATLSILTVVMVVSAGTPAFASEGIDAAISNNISVTENVSYEQQADSRLLDIVYQKKDVENYNEWGEWERVSDNLTTDSDGGSISCTEEVRYGVDIEGETYGLIISASGSVSTTIGYTLNVPANSTAYMAYRVYYSVEEGTREVYDYALDRVISSNHYKVKAPLYGQYKLIYV